MLTTKSNIRKIAEEIHKIHQRETADNTTLKLLIRKRDEAVKASKNIIKAIEQGIISEMTKNRLSELEIQISEYEFEINKEKQRSYTFLTIEDIENYLSSKVFENAEDIKVRKLIVNTFIREIILYKR